MKKSKIKLLISVMLVGTMIFGFSLTAFAEDGTELTDPTGGNATVTNESGLWKVEGDDDNLAKATDDDMSQIGVFAQVNITGAAVYKVDIAWGQMKFAYTNNGRVWNPSTHEYETDNSATVGWDITKVDSVNNKVTITNHSNSAITAALNYAHTLTGGESLFNETPAATDSVRGHFFSTNTAAQTAMAVLTNSATVVDELTTTTTIVACPEGATVEAGNIPKMDVYFTFNGTPDPEAVTDLGADYSKVGIITVTIGSGV